MRTNIVIDDELLRRARDLSGLPTKKAVVEEALRTLVQLREQERVLSLRGKIGWDGNLAAMRQSRSFDVVDADRP